MFCKNCGTEIQEGDKFCGKCGAKIEYQNLPDEIKENVKLNQEDQNKSKEDIKKLNDDTANLSKNKNRKLLKKIGIICIIFAMLLGTYIGVNNFIKEKERIARIEREEKLKVELPDVIGKTMEEAEKELSKLELNVEKCCDNYLDLAGKDPTSIVKKVTKDYGSIKAGDILKKGDTIEIWGRSQKWEEEQQEKKAKGYRSSPATTDTIISCAKTLIDNSLRSSSTAKWGTCEKIDEDNYGRCLVYVSLEAQNGFGAYSKLNYFVILQYVKSNGEFTYKPYSCMHELTVYGAQSVYDYYVKTYKNGEIYPVIQTFLDNNEWNVRPADV